MRYILVTKETYPLLLQGFTAGSDNLSSANPENDGRDKRPGKTGGEIVREERAIQKAILSLGNERELNDDELGKYADDFLAKNKRHPTLDDIKKIGNVLELKSDPCYLELNENLWERLKLYMEAVKWFARSAEFAVILLDLIELAPKEKPLDLYEVKNGVESK